MENDFLPNDKNHRVAAGDVDFKFRPVSNSSAFYCYPASSATDMPARWRYSS
jgi:hypothetical protein